MAKHKFDIVMDAPQQGKRYDEHESQKYACISVADNDLEVVAERLKAMDIKIRPMLEPWVGFTVFQPLGNALSFFFYSIDSTL